jgi:feruloyl esterase
MRRAGLALMGALGALVLPTHAQAPAAGARVACDVGALQQAAPPGTTITAAALVAAAAGHPAHCRVDGHAASPGNTVNFRLGLPSDWNGKFYFEGVGGLGGTIGPLTKGLARGYASASTDTGHEASDPTWGANRAKEIDYGHRGTHVTAVAARALTASFYGRLPAHAYFNGCSNGGRQAMMEVQRYPADFDGVIAGDPATGTPMQVGRAVFFQQLLAKPEHYLPVEKIELLSRATLSACDSKDGLADGLISDPRACDFDPASLVCTGPDTASCLTPAQVTSVKTIYAGVKDASGQYYAPAFPKGHEGGPTGWRGWITGNEPPVLQADGSLAFTGARVPSGFGLADAKEEILSPMDTDLRPFRKAGGKLIVYHGWADPGISALGTLDYIERMTRAVGGQAAADAFTRTYFVPGMHHCAGGPGVDQFDMLTVLERWVEQGEAPRHVVASRVEQGKTVRSRPLCPHPSVAVYSGSGSIDDAASFVCRAASR